MTSVKIKKVVMVCSAFLVGAVFPAGSASAAEEPKVEVTSFAMAGSRTRAAELCGKVTGGTGDWTAVRVVVDPRTNRPGVYHALAGRDGHFCLAVVTLTGRAEASIGWGAGKEAVAEASVTRLSVR